MPTPASSITATTVASPVAPTSSSATTTRLPRSPPKRRSSSIFTDSAVAEPTIPSEVPASGSSSPWNSVPLAFAVLPAVSGIFWTDGSHFVTDILLILLSAVFLHWLVRIPWEWYEASQNIPSQQPSSDDLARRKLERDEHLALFTCFLGPLAGGYFLHVVRSQLSRPSEGLVSNFNITVFVLAAELRPVAQVIKLIRLRTAYLQSCVHAPPTSRVDELATRVEELSAQVYALKTGEVEALNRAVRRYEKKEAAQENRIREVDNRVQDVMALAAAAAEREVKGVRERERSLVKVGTRIGDWVVRWALAGFVAPFFMLWRVVSLPAKAAELLLGGEGRRLLIREGEKEREEERVG